MIHSKFIRKYMLIAKTVGEVENSCFSRQIGVVVVDPVRNKIVNTGYNGPPKCMPVCSTPDKDELCPRRALGYASGEGLDLCPAAHAEVNALLNCAQPTQGCYMFCWCGIPCKDCAKYIVNAGIQRVYCLADQTYKSSYQSLVMFNYACVKILGVTEESILNPKGVILCRDLLLQPSVG